MVLVYGFRVFADQVVIKPGGKKLVGPILVPVLATNRPGNQMDVSTLLSYAVANHPDEVTGFGITVSVDSGMCNAWVGLADRSGLAGSPMDGTPPDWRIVHPMDFRANIGGVSDRIHTVALDARAVERGEYRINFSVMCSCDEHTLDPLNPTPVSPPFDDVVTAEVFRLGRWVSLLPPLDISLNRGVDDSPHGIVHLSASQGVVEAEVVFAARAFVRHNTGQS